MKVAALPFAAALCAACASLAAPPARNGFSFVVIGDTPYSDADRAMLEEAIPAIAAGGFPFVIHVGDYKGGREACATERDDEFAALVERLLPTPVFYTPGDNEWTDCDRDDFAPGVQRLSELARLARIRQRFFDKPLTGAEAFQYRRQPEQAENATWRHEGVRFATIHLVGTANGRDYVGLDDLAAAGEAADARDKANIAWISEALRLAEEERAIALIFAMQADLTDIGGAAPCAGASARRQNCDAFSAARMALQAAATSFDGPVLVIHGDTAPFTLNRTFAGDEAPNLWRLNAAGDANPVSGVRDVTLVTVNPKGPAPFAARAFLSGGSPAD